MRAEAFRQLEDPAPPRRATKFSADPSSPDVVHELAKLLSRLVETQELLIKEVREAARRPETPPPARDAPPEDSDGGRTVTYDWAPSPFTSPWE